MASLYSLSWRVFGSGYVATVVHTIATEPLTIYLRGSVGKDVVQVKHVEFDCRLTTGPVVALVDSVQQTIQAAGYVALNLSGLSDRVVIASGTVGDTLTLNLYNQPRTDWR